MIVPQNKLLFWVGIVVVPFAAAGTMVPSAAMPSAVIITIFIILISADAALACRRLEGISIEFPELVRMMKNREDKINICVKNNKPGKTKHLRIGLAFPLEFQSFDDDPVLEIPAGSLVSNFTRRCMPVKRGRYFFDKCYIECISHLGFWAVRAACRVRCEVRVYPDLSFERKNLAALFMNRGSFGVHAQRQIGQGRDFEKLREYVQGDTYEHIHWKATAKRSRPITKVFQIERIQEVYIIADASRLSGRSIKISRDGQDFSETILERFITASLIMGVAARRQGDRFGILSFSNKVHNFLRAKSGRTHYNDCREIFYKLQPRVVTPDFDEVCTFIGSKLRRRALLVFLTNLDDPVLAESFIRNMDLLCRRHYVLVNMIRPEHMKPLFSEPKAESVDDIYRALGGHILWHSIVEIEKVLKRKGVRFSLLDNENMCSHLVSQYLNVKQRQLI